MCRVTELLREDLRSLRSRDGKAGRHLTDRAQKNAVLCLDPAPSVSNFPKSPAGLWGISEKSENFFKTCDKTQPERDYIKMAEYGRFFPPTLTT